jgi:hypothetical protein
VNSHPTSFKEDMMKAKSINRILTVSMTTLLLISTLICSTSATAAPRGIISFLGAVTEPSPIPSKIINNGNFGDDFGEDADDHFTYKKEPVAGNALVLSSDLLEYYSTYASPNAILLTLAVH